ncbi:MAG: glycosyltransferase family 2 protein [Pseudomonadales bacterium]|jgi:cellulose synthase/poly-beta-1,6-N-acetylglucosamine synthase-like glycosyltransferase|nr:glycosyltransferase family 2 protein [Pseudomonadales bacterium]
MLEVLFWCVAALIIYVYAGYPLLLVGLRALRGRRPVAQSLATPSVTLIISAFNEAQVIREKLANSLELDYPPELLDILVVSDASDDGTDDMVSGYDSPRVKLLRMSSRGGKTVGLNAAARAATGEVLVFSDANAIYERATIRKLVRNFADPQVGGVVGESGYTRSDAAVDREESRYWSYETAIKVLETDIGSVVGGDGAIYAVRRALYEDMRADALSDFVNPLQTVRRGYRFVYEREARCFEEGAENFSKEFGRKVRIVNRAWRAAMNLRELANPLRFGVFAWQFISHKLLRWLVGAMLIALLLLSIVLAPRGLIYTLALIGQLAFYLLALAGFALRRRGDLPTILNVPLYFCMVNYAALKGIYEAYAGKTYTTWTTVRAQQPEKKSQ